MRKEIMTDRELRKLKRIELLEIMIGQNREIERLQAELTKTERELTPTTGELEAEWERVRYQKRYRQALYSTVSVLIVVAAVAVLVATLLLPILRIYGSSMTPTLREGEIVVSVKGADLKRGDIVAFYYNNKVLIKRVIAFPGEWVDIDDTGYVTVDGKRLTEAYLKEHALGDTNIALPYQVPESRYFVMGDHRSTSVDSRNTAVGCVAEEEIVGRIVFRVWPFSRIGRL